jgi:hypothetical protein
MSIHQHLVLGDHDSDLSMMHMEEEEDEWNLVGRKTSRLIMVWRPIVEKATNINGDVMMPMVSDTSTTSIMVTIFLYNSRGNMMKYVKLVKKRWHNYIKKKHVSSSYSNRNMRNLSHKTSMKFGKGRVSLESLRQFIRV